MSTFTDIPTRSNGEDITYSWFNILRTAGISLENNAVRGSLVWHDGDSGTPSEDIENNIKVRMFENGVVQDLPATFVVPQGYTAGKQIKLLALIYGATGSKTLLLSATSTLIRKSTDVISSTTNQHNSTNTAQSITTAYVPYAISIDLTDSSGKINSVSVSAGDIIKISLFRGTDSDDGDLRFIQFATDLTIS